MTATGLTAYTTLLTSATANAAVFGMLMSMAAVGAFMALFFTSLTVIYSVTLALTTFATGTVLFLSMCAALIVAATANFWNIVSVIIQPNARIVADLQLQRFRSTHLTKILSTSTDVNM
ncbi:hypothetical protein CY35_06G099900 [Sphagnum magellanicum]|nr:hypothetical protein CY35_06G099900 [Sphagnum magellanicum]